MYREKGIFKKTIVYFAMVLFACGSYMLSHSTFPKTFEHIILLIHLFDYISYILAILLICMYTYEKREIIVIACISVVVFLSAFLCGDVILIKGLLIVLASKEIGINEILKSYLFTIIVFGGLIVGSCLLKVIPDVTEARTNGLVRHSLGFSHPNRLGMVIMLLCLLNLFWRYNRYRICDLLLNVISLVCLARVANSKTALIVVALVLFFEFFCIVSKGKIAENIHMVCWGSIIFAPLFSLWFTVRYDGTNQIQRLLNELFTGRLYLSNRMYQLYGFPLAGQEVKTITALEATRKNTEVLALDNFYAYLGIQFGISILFLILVLLSCSAFKLSKNKMYGLFAWVALIMIYGIMENQIIDLRINFTMVLIFKYLMSGSHYLNDKDIKGEL